MVMASCEEVLWATVIGIKARRQGKLTPTPIQKPHLNLQPLDHMTARFSTNKPRETLNKAAIK